MSTGAGFTHPEYLADPGWLQAHLSNPNLVVVDLDAEAGYLRGHIPGAVHLANNYERNPETGWVNTQPPKRFAATCQSLGIGDATLVVAYDNNLSLYAARFWWALNYYGHRNVRVLDGGWRRWVAEGGQISFDRAIPRSGAAFTPEVVQSLIAGFDEVRAGCSLDDRPVEDTVIWDTRSAGEYSGAVHRANKRAGHVTGAAHLDWQDTMDRETHRFRPAPEIRQMLNDRGMTPDKAVFAY